MFQQGQQIGSYTLLRKLGKGGFGEVWLAEKRSQFVNKKVAVKLPLDEQVNFDAIRQEAELWEQASGHQNVLPIIDADIIDGQVVIVSEYADGGSLADRLKPRGKLPLKQAVEMTIGILNGLEFLHNRKIIHRDIKPQNILLQGDTPRLADFGISRAMQTTTVSSTIIGTDAYMSPESFDGKRSVQTDIWSVGVVLFQLLTGRLPFPQEHPSERMFAIIQRDFEILPNEIPKNLQDNLRKALAKLPKYRFQKASEMRNDLQQFLLDGSSTVNVTEQPTLVVPIPDDNPSVATVITPDNRPHPEPRPDLVDTNEPTPIKIQSSMQNNSHLWFALIGVLLVIIAGTSIYFSSRSGGNQTAKVNNTTITKPNPDSTSPKNANSSLTNITNSSNQETNFNNATPTTLINSEKKTNADIGNSSNTVSDTPTPIPNVDISGTWIVSYQFKDPNNHYNPNPKGQTQFKIKKTGETLFVESQDIHGEFYPEPNGKIKGDKVTIYLEEKGQRVAYIGTIRGNTMTGSIKPEPGTWSAKKL